MCSHGEEDVLDMWVAGRQYQFRRPVVRRWLRAGAAARQAGTVVTPMPGKIVKVRTNWGWGWVWGHCVWPGLATAWGWAWAGIWGGASLGIPSSIVKVAGLGH
jgi:hypothetical protein